MKVKTYTAAQVAAKRKRKPKKPKSIYGKVTHPKAKFFEQHAGYGHIPGKETPAQGRARGARSLAAAEREGKRRGWNVEWEYDPLPYDMGDAETEMPNEVLVAVLKDQQGNVLASVGGIGDPSRQYRRVVEAELMSEALNEGRRLTALRRGF